MAVRTDDIRFRVLKVDEKLELYGVLHENVKCDVIDDFLSETTHLSLKALQSVSWNGLLHLHKYLCSHPKRCFVLHGIPARLYGYLKIIKDFGEHIELASFELQSFRPTRKPLIGKPLLFSLASLSSVAAAQKRWLRQGEDMVLGSQAELLPHTQRFATLLPPTLARSPSDAANLFFHGYLLFSSTSLSLAKDLLASVCSSLSRQFDEINAQLAGFEAGLALLAAGGEGQALDRQGAFTALGTECLNAIQELGTLTQNYEEIVCLFQAELAKEAVGASFLAKPFLADVARCAEGAQHIAGRMEDIGSQIGAVMLNGDIVGPLAARFAAVDPAAVHADVLAQVRDRLSILNPMSADNWTDTLADIQEEIGQTDALVKQSSVLLQGFDLTRQVLEHRVQEHLLIAQSLSAGLDEDAQRQDLQSSLVEKIAKKLVTDQEKYAFAYYLPEEFAKGGQKHKMHPPGDVLLF